MTSQTGPALAIDLGAATTSVAILGPLGGRRRLLAALAMPAGTDLEAMVDHLLDGLRSADPDLAELLGIGPEARADWPRLVARSVPPPTLAVLATTVRERAAIERLAGLTGWRTIGASLDPDGPIELTRVALLPEVAAVAVGAVDPTSREETAALAELAAVAGGISARIAGVPLLLLGAVAGEAPRIVGELDAAPLFGPGPEAGGPAGAPLRRFLEGVVPDRPAEGGPSARRAALTATEDLARILDRRVELVEIGFDGGARAVAGPGGLEGPAAIVPGAALVPDEPGDDLVDGVLAWSTVVVDRHRLRDRLRELRLSPWVEAYGDGALLRMAAARAALERLVTATPDLSALPAPDLLLVAGGAWAAAPGPAIALALVDVVRRPGVSQLAYDHARLLGPLGAVEDPQARRVLLADLADDLLAPLGSAIVPQGLRAGRTAGRLTVRGPSGETELELVPGGLELVDLPPGQLAVADLRFQNAVVLGGRGRHLSVEVGGGLGGLLVDLRDVPLRLPERAERRRALLDAWQGAFWAGLDR